MGYRFSCNLYFFIHRQPNNIGPAWQQPKALFLISLSLVGEGRGHSYYILALRLLDYMGFAMEAKPEWKMGVGHTLQPHSLGTGDRCPHPPTPNLQVLFGTGRGHKNDLCSPTRLQQVYNAIIYKPRPHSQPCLCPHDHLFFPNSSR